MRGSPEWYDRMFNNRALVPDFADHLQRWAKDSRQARDNANCLLDLSYGAGPNETLDIFPTHTTNAPVLVFLHGGYWRALDKSDHSFIAPAFTQKGICVVVPNYALCPAVSIADIVMQMVKALSWVWRYIHEWGGDPSRIHVAGHSAGGHLAAMMMACEWSRYAPELPLNLVKSALAISGLFELASVRNSPMLQTDLRLDDSTVLQCSPAWMTAPVHASLRSVVGALESEEFLRHNALIRQAWGVERVPVSEALPDLHHFSMLSALVHPEHRLHHMASDMCLAS